MLDPQTSILDSSGGETNAISSPEANRRLALFHEQLLDRVSRIPGVVAVGGINSLPMTEFGGNGTFLINNDRTRTGYAEYRQASEGYFGVMGIPLLRGRLFQREDGPDSPHVAVISKSLADKIWPDEARSASAFSLETWTATCAC